MDNTIMTAVEKCWHSGYSIGDTIKNVQRNQGVKLDFIEVQKVFARLSLDYTTIKSTGNKTCSFQSTSLSH